MSMRAPDVATVVSTGKNLEDPPISAGDQEIIKYWMKAADVNHANRCSVDYVRKSRQKIESDKKVTSMNDMDGLYEQVMNDVLSSCGKEVTKKVAELGLTLRDYCVFGTRFNFAQRTHAQKHMRALAEWMLRMVGEDKRGNLQVFSQAWRDGPCGLVQSKLSEPDFGPVANYIDMINESQVDPMKLQLSLAAIPYIPVIQGCEHFENSAALKEIWSSLQTGSGDWRKCRTQCSTE